MLRHVTAGASSWPWSPALPSSAVPKCIHNLRAIPHHRGQHPQQLCPPQLSQPGPCHAAIPTHWPVRSKRRAPWIHCSAAASSDGQAADDDSKPIFQSVSTSSTPTFKPKLLALIILVLALGVANRVLYRVALVPMSNYIFFIATTQNIGYLVFYFTTLYLRYRAGLVTDAMLKIEKRPLWAIGACESISQLLFMVSASHLPGALLPVINQSYLCWNLMFASIILGTKFSRSQLGGTALILVGVVLAAFPSFSLSSTAPLHMGYVGMAVLCFAFPALASIIKDMIFRKERERLGQPLDIFMVNSFGSLYQSVFVLLLLPVNLALVGVQLPDLPSYLHEGMRCLAGLTPSCGSDCRGAPVAVFAYVAANIAFNIGMLVLLRSMGAVSTTLAGSCLVPLTILAFMTLPLPLPPSVVGPYFGTGTAILCIGLLVFNYNAVVRPLGTWLSSLPSPNESVDLPAP